MRPLRPGTSPFIEPSPNLEVDLYTALCGGTTGGVLNGEVSLSEHSALIERLPSVSHVRGSDNSTAVCAVYPRMFAGLCVKLVNGLWCMTCAMLSVFLDDGLVLAVVGMGGPLLPVAEAMQLHIILI